MSARALGHLLLGIALLPSCVFAGQSTPSPSPAPSPVATAPGIPPVSTPSPTRTLLVTPTPLPTTRTATGFVVHENPILGYRITLPETMRRESARINAGSDTVLGNDEYTHRTEAQAREACLNDLGWRRRNDELPNVIVDASRNASGLSAEAWATTPRAPGAQPLSTHMLVERTTIDGREAVRLVRDQAQNREPTVYVIRANDRMYTIHRPSDSIPSLLPPGRFDQIATSFRAIQAGAFPPATSPPFVPPNVTARILGQRLSEAFAARDVDVIAGLISPQCWIGTLPIVPPGTGVDGSSRAVVPFLTAIREGFARGTLTVSVDATVQDSGGQLFVRSEWRTSGTPLRIELLLSEIERGMYWTSLRFENVTVPCDLRRIVHGEQSGSSC